MKNSLYIDFISSMTNVFFMGLSREEILNEVLKIAIQQFSLFGGAIYVKKGDDSVHFVKYREYKRANGKGDFSATIEIETMQEIFYTEEQTFFPVSIDNSIIGILAVLGTIEDQEEVRVFQYVSHVIALILKKTFFYSVKNQRKMMELTPLYEITKDITIALDPLRLLRAILDGIYEIINFDNCMIFLLDEEANVLNLAVSRGLKKEENPVKINIAEDPVISQVIRDNQAILITNLAKDNTDKLGLEQRVNSFMAIPLSAGEEIVGTMNFAMTGEVGYTEEDVRLINIIASQVAVLYKISAALSELQMHSQNMLRSITTGVVTFNKKKEIVIMNDAVKNILGEKYRSKEEIISFFKSTGLNEKIESTVSGNKVWESSQIEFAAGAENKYLIVSITPLLNINNENEGAVVAIDDITSRIVLEREINRNERLAALGQLSAGIAHEVRNPLTAIRGFTQLLPTRYDDPSFRDKFVNIMMNETERLKKIVDELLTFARPGQPNITKNKLNTTIERLLLLIKNTAIKQNVEITDSISSGIEFYYDENQIEQALINIMLNAIQAMPDGGKLKVTALINEENLIEIDVEDTGKGMSDDEKKNLFNPFFTTKDHGTGLGMSITHKIIEEHNGSIRVESHLGKGTLIRILLPYKKQL